MCASRRGRNVSRVRQRNPVGISIVTTWPIGHVNRRNESLWQEHGECEAWGGWAPTQRPSVIDECGTCWAVTAQLRDAPHEKASPGERWGTSIPPSPIRRNDRFQSSQPGWAWLASPRAPLAAAVDKSVASTPSTSGLLERAQRKRDGTSQRRMAPLAPATSKLTIGAWPIVCQNRPSCFLPPFRPSALLPFLPSALRNSSLRLAVDSGRQAVAHTPWPGWGPLHRRNGHLCR